MITFSLNNGITVPAVGFGTYKASAEAIGLAIEAGCRYFDTASFYGNEGMLGAALRDSGLPRKEFLIASKVWKTDLGYAETLAAFGRTLEALGTDYVDAYLIHWPRPDLVRTDWRELDRETWRAMEELYSAGKIRALGLSNFHPHHAENIIRDCAVMPSVAQLEFHPGYMQASAVNYYHERKILVQAWSPTGRGRVVDDVLIQELAAKYKVSPVQVCLAFCVNEGVMPLPKASTLGRIRENLEASNITLEREDIMRLENMPPMGWSGEHPDRERVKIV
ncbi:MAG: aldo/keto reductase [Synergistaceae bacterium]|nr:aldo/keto reductase [Synergistaceae bacterium]